MGLEFKEPQKPERKGVFFRDASKKAMGTSGRAEGGGGEKEAWGDRDETGPQRSTIELPKEHRKIQAKTARTVRSQPVRSSSLGSTSESCDDTMELRASSPPLDGDGERQMTDALEEQLTFQDDEELRHRNPFLHQFESTAMTHLLRNSYIEYKKLPAEERTKMDKVSHYAPVFPNWVTEHPLFTSVDRVIRDRDTKEALSADPGNRSAKQLERVALWLREMWSRGKQASHDDLEALAHCVHYEVLKGGELMAAEGLIGYAMVIVVEGSVEGKSSTGKGTVLLGPGDSFGDAILRAGKEVWERTMTAKANPTAVLKVRKSALEAYGKDKKAMETHQAMRCFRANPMFRGWPRSKLEKMCHMVQRKVYMKGDVVVRQDDVSDDVYFIIEGRCEVFKEVKLSSKNRWPKAPDEWEEKARTMMLPFKIMDLGVGDYFGERAILRDTGRAATVVAAERTVCMALGKAEFLNMLQRGATVIESVYAQSNSYPTDEEVLTLFTALRIQRRHEDLIRASIKKTKEGFRPGDDDINVRKTDLKSRDVLTLPKRYGRLLDHSRERVRRESVIMSTESVKPAQTRRIVRIARKLVCSQKPLSRNDIKKMRAEGKPMPSGFANEILRQAANTTNKPAGSAKDGHHLSLMAGFGAHHSPITRYMRVQDSLPALISITYKATRPQLVPQEDKDPFSTVELSQMSTGVFMKLHAPSIATPATR